MTSDHASARRCSASQFRNEYLASDKGNRQGIYMDRYVVLFKKKLSFYLENLEMIFSFFFFYVVEKILLKIYSSDRFSLL